MFRWFGSFARCVLTITFFPADVFLENNWLKAEETVGSFHLTLTKRSGMVLFTNIGKVISYSSPYVMTVGP